ncbi:hypothetical protein ACOM2C_15115 [Pseudarthrobacter sp. So.54]
MAYQHQKGVDARASVQTGRGELAAGVRGQVGRGEVVRGEVVRQDAARPVP